VAGVKIESDGEKLAAGVEAPPECQMQSGECRAAIHGISCEKAQKAQKQRDFFMAHGRDYRLVSVFSRCRWTGQRPGQRNGAPLLPGGSEWFTWSGLSSAAFNGNAYEKTRVAQKQRNLLDCIFTTKSLRIGHV